MKEVEPDYQENFEDILRVAHLEGQSRTFYMESIIAFFAQGGVLLQQPGCPWCGR